VLELTLVLQNNLIHKYLVKHIFVVWSVDVELHFILEKLQKSVNVSFRTNAVCAQLLLRQGLEVFNIDCQLFGQFF
jgi:hypothetical protein